MLNASSRIQYHFISTSAVSVLYYTGSEYKDVHTVKRHSKHGLYYAYSYVLVLISPRSSFHEFRRLNTEMVFAKPGGSATLLTQNA